MLLMLAVNRTTVVLSATCTLIFQPYQSKAINIRLYTIALIQFMTYTLTILQLLSIQNYYHLTMNR